MADNVSVGRIQQGRAHAVPVPAASAGRLVQTGQVTLLGWSLREATGTAGVVVDIYDGADVGGSPVAAVALPAGGSETVALAAGIALAGGVYIDVISGAIQGAIYIAPAEA